MPRSTGRESVRSALLRSPSTSSRPTFTASEITPSPRCVLRMTRLFGPGPFKPRVLPRAGTGGIVAQAFRRKPRRIASTTCLCYLELPQRVPRNSRRPCPVFWPPAMAWLGSHFLGAVDLAPRNRFGRR
jgi:hypothetical protein